MKDQKMKYDIAIIGAGMAGLSAANKLRAKGKNVIVFEKSRGTGGRLASKRITLDTYESLSFDLGCPAISYETSIFKNQLDAWLQDGVVARSGSTQNAFVGERRNSGITRHLTQNMDIRFSTRILHMEHHLDTWHLYADNDPDRTQPLSAKKVILATPPQQAFDLLPEGHRLKSRLKQFDMLPQWVLLLAVHSTEEFTFNKSTEHHIECISAEHTKRKRRDSSDVKMYQVQASTRWSQSTLEWDKEDVFNQLISQLRGMTNQNFTVIEHHIHRWLYSRPSSKNPLIPEGFLASKDGVYICGDYLGKAHSQCDIEAAYLSGHYLANTDSLN